MSDELPKVITNTLDRHGYVAITKEEHARLLTPKQEDRPWEACPYPLFREKFGWTHREYIGAIERDGTYPLSVVKCTACHHVTIEEPIVLAAP